MLRTLLSSQPAPTLVQDRGGGPDIGDAIGEAISMLGQTIKSAFEGAMVQGPPGLPGPPGPPGGVLFGPSGVNGVDGVDTLADIDVPIPYTGTSTKWEEKFEDNSPSAGKVSWASFYVRYKGNTYTVAANASGTASEVIYWDAASPTALSGGTLPQATGVGKWAVGFNETGTFAPSGFVKAMNAGLLKAGTIVAGLIKAGAVETDKINGLAVTTAKVGDGAITGYDLATSASGSYVVGGTNVVTVGSFVLVDGYAEVIGQVDVQASSWVLDTVTVKLLRGATEIRATSVKMADNTRTSVVLSDMDAPGAGTYDYKMRISGVMGGGDYWNADLIVRNVKK
jgi:hypothetical protein